MTRPVTRQEIKQIVKEFKNGKAPGLSGINKTVLLNLSDVTWDRFVAILNLTISLGYFPIILKNGLTILILKSDKDPRQPTSYRPITLLELPGKILERILNNRFQRFLREQNLYNNNQYGFIPGRGTELAIAKTYETTVLR